VSGSILSLQPDLDALALIEPMVDTGRFGSHVWPKRVPKLCQAVQVFIGLKQAMPTKPSANKKPAKEQKTQLLRPENPPCTPPHLNTSLDSLSYRNCEL
jgi:hypothetical protein